ncbi:MAG: penicillin acylase family protein [Pseudomonadales bacterium]
MSVKPWLVLLLLAAAGCGNGLAVDGRPVERETREAGRDAAAAKRLPATPLDAEIRWTSYGIPHVKAADRASLGYGFAYATARNAICVIARDVVVVNGELSRYFGDTEANLASDIFHKAILDDPRIAAFHRNDTAAAAAFARGYVAGYNRYLRDHRQRLPASCAGADWLRPITADDAVKLTVGVGIRYGLGRYRHEVAAATPPPGRFFGRAPVTDFDLPEGYGSNAVAFGRAATESGHGLLLGNPHYPWHGPSRFHLIHTTIPGELDVMGVSLYNTSRIGIGFNRDVAWTHTVSTATRATLYELSLHPRNPLRYRYGGRYRDMDQVTVAVQRLAADGSLVTEEHSVYLTHYGPVVASQQLPWTRSKAYAVRDANLHNDRGAITYDALHRAANIDEVEAAISLQGTPWTNTIAADRHGTAFYGDLSVTPNLDAVQLQICRLRPEGIPERVVVLDGADPECEWLDDERSAIPGAMPAEEMPRIKRDDYVANANDSYWIANPEQPLEGYSPIIGSERTALSLRSRAGFSFIRQQLETTGSISPEQLQNMLYSQRNYAAELFLDDVLALCRQSPDLVELEGRTVSVAPACTALAGWDRRMTNNSRGGHVWREFWREARDVEYLFAIPFVVSSPLDTPNGLAVADPDVSLALLHALAVAQTRLEANGIDLDAELGTIQYAQRNDERLPIPGGEGWAGMWSMIVSELTPSAGYTPIVSGNSYIQVVSWDDEGRLDARGMLTYSQSPEPDSPHFADLTRLYSAGQWISLPFEEAEIAADPNLATLRLRE